MMLRLSKIPSMFVQTRSQGHLADAEVKLTHGSCLVTRSQGHLVPVYQSTTVRLAYKSAVLEAYYNVVFKLKSQHVYPHVH